MDGEERNQLKPESQGEKKKPEKTSLRCPKPKCGTGNAFDATECALCKTSLTGAETIIVADDWDYIMNYISLSGILFVLIGLIYAKYSMGLLIYCLVVAIIMWPILLRTLFKKFGRNPPGFIMRTVIAFVFLFGAMIMIPSPEQMKVNDDQNLRDAAATAAVKASEEASEKKFAEEEEKRVKAQEAAEKVKEEAKKKVEEEANKPKRSEKELLKGFSENLKDAKLTEFIEGFSIDKHNINKLDIVATNAMFTVDKQIRKQFVQKLWQMWSDICFFNVKDIDSCRIKVKDIMGNTVAESSVWGGSIVKLKD